MSIGEGAAELEVLLRGCRRGDARSWNTLVERFQGLVYSIPRRMGLSDDDSSDVFQATFTALFKHVDRIESASTIPKWLSTTASRESFRLIRQRRNQSVIDIEDQTLEDVLKAEDVAVDEQVLKAEMAELISAGLSSISPKCQELLQLLYRADEVSYQDISDQLGMPIGSIGPTRARCLEKLRSVLEKAESFRAMYQDSGNLTLTA